MGNSPGKKDFKKSCYFIFSCVDIIQQKRKHHLITKNTEKVVACFWVSHGQLLVFIKYQIKFSYSFFPTMYKLNLTRMVAMIYLFTSFSSSSKKVFKKMHSNQIEKKKIFHKWIRTKCTLEKKYEKVYHDCFPYVASIFSFQFSFFFLHLLLNITENLWNDPTVLWTKTAHYAQYPFFKSTLQSGYITRGRSQNSTWVFLRVQLP